MGAGDLYAHLQTRTTHVARCWYLTRKDGVALGFTDHDLPISFDGMDFAADAGLSARALQQGTGLAVDNSEALGALSHVAIREEDIAAGRYDGAEILSWLVNWQNVEERVLQFRGHIGEVTRVDGQFTAELRGLTEALNQKRERVYQKPCTAVLGDSSCRVDITAPEFRAISSVIDTGDQRTLTLSGLDSFAEGWFTRGVLKVTSGTAQGLSGVIKEDKGNGPDRRILLWSDLRAELEIGDLVEAIAGCDKAAETCRVKFSNFNNFRGFPHVPGEDWLMSYPTRLGDNDGGAL